MPSREYYLNDRVSDYIHAYLQYMVDTAVLFGANQTDAERDMYQVLQFETKIANASITRKQIFYWKLTFVT